MLDPATLARAYASADVCAQPAVIEELSNAVLEAASSGLPLMVSAGSGSERFVVEGKTGLVVRDGDAGGVGGGAAGRAARSGAAGGDGTGGARVLAGPRPVLARRCWPRICCPPGTPPSTITAGRWRPRRDRLRDGRDRLRRRPGRARAAGGAGGACAAWCGRPATPRCWRACRSSGCAGDVTDAASVRAGMAGCDEVFHCAADYRLYARDPAEIYRTNVEGTRVVLARGRALGVRRIVYTELGGDAGGARRRHARRRDAPVAALDDMIGDYKRSKLLARARGRGGLARRACRWWWSVRRRRSATATSSRRRPARSSSTSSPAGFPPTSTPAST